MSIALVAGGTSGIGLATARRLQRRGYDVHVTGRGKERLDDVASSDPELTGHQADGGNATAMAALAASLGTVDVLVVSLSGAEGMGPIDSLDLAMLRRAFDAKFWAHLVTIQAVLPHLAADGSITLLSAITARAAMAGTAGIGALNAAIEALVKPLAVELAPRRVNAVSPGVVDTAWWSGFPDEMREGFFAQTAASIPVRRVATADDVAEVVTLAATNQNLTGTVLEADGGARLVSLG
ncbi:short-chain dehydrogenase/reductase SDR [Amycolatopsis mediterranei S699]|uniref:Short-chain dehydrogenase/reductase SDR n=2 Tax=Amycolatopsis mediterranei TaxID=33910 RepID=A0A0H3DEC5_AMYMU|nr:SDR family oxidoreductase [Amycolatopsis mediterranei]ADJ48428.1 short-chain dehydrogenase/reductase SDR [Amycolatopsis mediterranei U32]AEK45349.1 short-chain dehydrogenase/reductase SDR [Amycolatopsis mediterranei S699]AFO80139.1 short-chain dehydrogenase/reductase SDR [Amycolatopsis mediterranei S699]AGT87267.1 short-chain dehydrogenase/reductase SDR [Amycolatopsis mediterranei RB]KDO10945.1 short-chain dehydrogenase [Amycolatopsis mediterranei]